MFLVVGYLYTIVRYSNRRNQSIGDVCFVCNFALCFVYGPPDDDVPRACMRVALLRARFAGRSKSKGAKARV